MFTSKCYSDVQKHSPSLTMLKNGSKASHYADVTVLDLGPTVFCNIVLPFIKWENLDQEIIRPFLSVQLEFLVIQHF